MFLEAITDSPFNVFFTIGLIGLGLAYIYYRKPPTSSSSSATSSFPSRFNTTNSVSPRGIIDEDLQRSIAEIERQERIMIRQEQDQAYKESLKIDREKKLKKDQETREKEAIERAEKERIAKKLELHNRLIKLRAEISDKLPLEPNNQHDQKDVVKLVFKLPDGTRVKRSFRKDDKVEHLYWYVFSLNHAPLQFKMTTNFPKRDLPGRPPLPEDFDDHSNPEPCSTEPNCEQTLAEANLTETQIIFVYDLEA